MPKDDGSATAFDKINFVRSFDDGNITPSQKLILLVIATHLGDNDFVFLSLTTFMQECCLTRTNASSNLKKLINCGYLIKLPPSDGFRSCRFLIDFKKLASTKTVLVPEQYLTSTGTVLDQYRNSTTLVPEQYPNRKIKLFKRKIKEKTRAQDAQKPFVPEDQKPDQKQPQEPEQPPKPIEVFTVENFQPNKHHFAAAQVHAVDCIAECAKYLEKCETSGVAPTNSSFIVWLMKQSPKLRREPTAEKQAMNYLKDGDFSDEQKKPS